MSSKIYRSASRAARYLLSASINSRFLSAYMLQDQEVLAAEIAEIISRFERKGFKLVGIKVLVPSKDLAEKHYPHLKETPYFNGICNFLSSGPVIAMVWEGEGVIKYGRKLIGSTDPQKSKPGTIRGDLAAFVLRNIIHGSDAPETAKDELICGSNQKSWLATQAMPRSGSMAITEARVLFP